MSFSYLTSAKPRGRKSDTENSDRSSGSRATSEASQRSSKKKSRSSEESGPKSSRPTSPVMLMQRSRGIDSKMSTIDPISPKSSTSSMRAERHTWIENDAPMVIPPSKTTPRSTPSLQSMAFPPPDPIRNPTQPSINSRPGTPMSRASEVSLHSKAPSITSPSQITFNPSSASPVSGGSLHNSGSMAAFQPRVDDFVDDNTPTASPAKSPPSRPAGRPESVPPIPPLEPALERAISPPLSPRLVHHGGYPGQPQMQQPQMYGGYYPMQQPQMYAGGPYYAPPFSPPSEHSLPNSEGRSRSASDDEHHHLLEKVASVLPDINRLLDQYRETHGQLSAKELLVKQSETMHADQLNSLRVELDANKTEYEKVITSVVTDNGQLKRESEQLKEKIAGLEKIAEEHAILKAEFEKLEAKNKDLTESVDSVRLSKEQLLTDKLGQDKNIDSLKKQHHTDKEKHHRSLSELKEQLKQQLAEKDEAHAKTLTEQDDVHKKALEERDAQHSQLSADKEKTHSKALGEHKVIISKVQLELANLITKHSNQKRDLESTRISEAEHKGKLDAKSKEFDEAVAKHSEEIEAFRRNSEEEHQGAMNESEERATKLMEEHSNKEKEWVQSMDALRSEMQTQQEEFSKHRNIHEAYKKEQDEKSDKHAELAATLTSWKIKHLDLQKENENMDRVLNSLGHATEVKSKGDEFFIATFQQLSGLIIDLSRVHFSQTPRTPPREMMLLIPAEIPDFMRSSDSAYELRSLYIQHKIWSVLNTRIFQPFLFTIGRHFGGVETFLSSLSLNIRQKSERREAAWRQTTLRAAYKVSHAKEAINLVAAMIVEEILTEIKPFAVSEEWPALTLSTQRIVKASAEVWRSARIEREMVTASMPDVAEEDGSEWLEARSDAESGPLIKTSNTMVLRVTPHIVRHRVHDDFLPAEERESNAPCIYLQGRALLSDSHIIAECQSGQRRGVEKKALSPTARESVNT